MSFGSATTDYHLTDNGRAIAKALHHARAAESVALLRTRIEESGLTAHAFARDVLLREPRTIRRWLAADSPVPNRVREWLENPPLAPWPLAPPPDRV